MITFFYLALTLAAQICTIFFMFITLAKNMDMVHSRIAFFFSGQAGLSPRQVADSMMDGVMDMIGKTPQSTLKLVRLVVFQASMLPEFLNSMQYRETGPAKQEKESTWSKIKSMNLITFTSN